MFDIVRNAVKLARKAAFKQVWIGLVVLLMISFTGCGKSLPSPTKYNVSGRITDGNGNGIAGVNITFNPSYTAVQTNIDGKWSSTGLAGTVMLTPAKQGWTFNPSSHTVNKAAIDVNFNATSTTPPDTTAPATPTGLQASGGIKKVTLTWVRPSDADLVGFNIQRSIGRSGTYAIVNSVLINHDSFTDENVSTGTYYCYKVNAVDSSSNESGWTTPACATAYDENTPPKANITSKGETKGFPTIFDGSQSTTVLGSIQEYKWEIDDTIKYGAKVSHTYITSGRKTVRFTVKNSYGITHTIEYTFSIYDPATELTGQTLNAWYEPVGRISITITNVDGTISKEGYSSVYGKMEVHGSAAKMS